MPVKRWRKGEIAAKVEAVEGVVEALTGSEAVQVENIQQHFAETIKGTAIDHLQSGLFEAHARDARHARERRPESRPE